MAGRLSRKAKGLTGITRVSVLFANIDREPAAFWIALESASGQTKLYGTGAEVALFSAFRDVDWQGHELLFCNLLRHRDKQLGVDLLQGLWLTGNFTPHLGTIEYWLEWMAEPTEAKLDDMLASWLSKFLIDNASADMQRRILETFNDPMCKWRQIMADHLIRDMDGISIEDLSDDAIGWLMTDLHRREEIPFKGLLVGHVATEKFVEEMLLPLLTSTDQPLRRNLFRVLRQAGQRHRRRYVTDDMQIET